MNRTNPTPRGSAIAIPLALVLTLLAISSGWWGRSWWHQPTSAQLGGMRP